MPIVKHDRQVEISLHRLQYNKVANSNRRLRMCSL